ncbi:MAG TPA: PorP/SprF family type IX secretion system membrane protein [Flavisolibacter sp.]|nr:PorP/SprF family type IX secretion system membrane protein [Flavisolibacter sp.]
MKNIYHQMLAGVALLTACCLLPSFATSQDIHFSQFFEAPLYRNPALAGIVHGDYRIQTVYRSQWNSITNAYKTTSINAEYKLPVKGNDYLTLAVQVFHDKAGTTNLTTTHALPAINYHKSLSDQKSTYLSIGFMGGYVQRRIDRSKITTNSTYNSGSDGEDALVPQYGYWDGSAGISFNTQLGENPENNLVVGAALHHFIGPRNSFYSNATIVMQPKWVFSADAKFGLNDQAYITLHNDYVKQGSYSEKLSGAIYTQKVGAYTDEPDFTVGAGAFMRWGDAVIPTLQLGYRPFALSMSYDVNVSKLSSTSYGQGGYELSLTYIGFLDRDNSSANAVLCPRF